MVNTIKQFVIDSLREMNYDVLGIDEGTMLGPAGADSESLAIAEQPRCASRTASASGSPATNPRS